MTSGSCIPCGWSMVTVSLPDNRDPPLAVMLTVRVLIKMILHVNWENCTKHGIFLQVCDTPFFHEIKLTSIIFKKNLVK